MIKNILIGGAVLLFLLLGAGCQRKKVPLDEKQFTALLIDIHRIDGALVVLQDVEGTIEMRNYAYYNDLFKKYGITRADFDTCIYYYSAQTAAFSKMYDVRIDSLNKQLTQVDKVLNELKANDSVNYFPVQDTLCLDSVRVIQVDSITPGLYKFSTTLQFDSISTSRLRRIASFFLSADQKDTLYVRDLIIVPDTNSRSYHWAQYVDTTYTQLVIRYLEVIPWEKRSKVYKNGKWIAPDKKERVYQLKDFGGRAWNNQLFRPYLSKREEKRWKQNMHRRK